MSNVSYDFAETVVLITGGARGLGRDMALQFANSGAKVVVCDVVSDLSTLDYSLSKQEDLDSAVDDISAMDGDALAVVADVRKESEVERIFARAVDHFGKVDVLVNNAGVYTGAKATNLTEEQWDVVLEVNLKGPFLCSKHAARHFADRNKGGRIITVSSTSALVGIPEQINYQSSKHGLVGQIRTLALELAPFGVTVNTVCPTLTESPLRDFLIRQGESYLQEVARLNGASTIFPNLEALEPRDVTEAVMWLASDAARYVTGVALPVDAGFTCK